MAVQCQMSNGDSGKVKPGVYTVEGLCWEGTSRTTHKRRW